MDIVVISGSPRKLGRTRIAAYEMAIKLKADLIDLSEEPMPLFNGDSSQGKHPAVQRLRQKAEEADAFVWVSPEYHNGMSGALKNALEFLNGTHFQRKPILLLSVCGGGKGGINAVNQMRTVGRGLYAMVVPHQMVFDPEDFDANFVLTEKAIERLHSTIEEFQQWLPVKV
ncbi:azobenzene reductase [Halobacillus alkaliphilus]|uniref:Azobenzene reductase n=1 Tax=Halobacillus alkaliphilus TaxID=396056 RepID=A0A1I2REH6_9BACI|nr:NADPH-dependent FMN reductase [Halobacillus alkaliphilus]SFG38892.1 azobenzene reductase [Halobacillus alkaliphilus]